MADRTCEVCGKEFDNPMAGAHLARHMRSHDTGEGVQPKSDPGGAGEPPLQTGTEPGPFDEEPPSSPYVAETPPAPSRPTGIGGRIRAWGRGRRGGQATPASARPTGETAPRGKPKGGKRRVPLDEDLSDLYGWLGRRLEGTPQYPTGRMLQFTSLAAGTIIDDGVANTLPDRVLFQPLARTRSKWEPVMVIIGLPLVTFRITNVLMALQGARQEGDADQVNALNRQLGMLTEAFDFLAEQGLPLLAPGVEKAREKQARKRKAMAQAFPDLGVDENVSPADALRSMLFDSPPGDMPITETEDGTSDRNGEAFSSAFGADASGAVA